MTSGCASRPSRHDPELVRSEVKGRASSKLGGVHNQQRPPPLQITQALSLEQLIIHRSAEDRRSAGEAPKGQMPVFGLPNFQPSGRQNKCCKPQNPSQDHEQKVRRSHNGEAQESLEALRSQESGADRGSRKPPRKHGPHARLKCRKGIVGRRIERADDTAARNGRKHTHAIEDSKIVQGSKAS